MSLQISPLSGATRFSNGFSIPPDPPDDPYGEVLYDLKNLLLHRRGFESEVAAEIQRNHRDLSAHGQFVPWEVFTRNGNGNPLIQRDLTAGTPSAGGSFTQVQRVPDIASALIPVSQCIASGATVLTDLHDDGLTFPRWQLPSTPLATSEVGAISSSGQTTSLLSLTPHRVSCMTTVSKQLLVQGSTMKLEELIKTEMLRKIGQEIDRLCLAGSGISPEPTGILSMPANTAGQRDVGKLNVPIAVSSPPLWTEAVSFATALESTDVDNGDQTFGFIVDPQTKGLWSTTEKAPGYPEYICSNNFVNGYKLRASNNLSSSARIIFARWSDVIIALWPLSIAVDALSLATSANVKIAMTLFMDVGVLRGPAVVTSQ